MSVEIKGLDELGKKFDERKITEELKVAMERTVAETKDAMVNVVKTTGTNNTWDKPWFGRSGSTSERVDSGKMLKAIETEVKTSGKSEVVGRVGWLHGMPEYAKHQEFGFTHYLSKNFVFGMHSIREGAERAIIESNKQVKDAIKRVEN
jgi:hypothetical protein